jgi:hypothetical protein
LPQLRDSLEYYIEFIPWCNHPGEVYNLTIPASKPFQSREKPGNEQYRTQNEDGGPLAVYSVRNLADRVGNIGHHRVLVAGDPGGVGDQRVVRGLDQAACAGCICARSARNTTSAERIGNSTGCSSCGYDSSERIASPYP